jgi:hypothetical protein
MIFGSLTGVYDGDEENRYGNMNMELLDRVNGGPFVGSNDLDKITTWISCH